MQILDRLDGAIPYCFGNGLLGTACTGLVRIPAFMANIVAVSMVAELSFRLLGEIKGYLVGQGQLDGYMNCLADKLKSFGFRPYENRQDWTNQQLVIGAIAMGALAIFGTEFVNLVGGRTPDIYNIFLPFFGPMRIDPRSVYDTVPEALRRLHLM